MSDLKVCRICLRSDKGAKYFRFNEFYLKCFYEEITTVPLSNNDGLPRYFCFQCAALLHKFHFFKEKCCYAQKTLKDMVLGSPLTYDNIWKVYSKQPIIKRGRLDIVKLSDRVKTYNMTFAKKTETQSKTRKKPLKSEENDEEEAQFESYDFDVDFRDDDSSEDDLPITQISSGVKKEITPINEILEDPVGSKIEEPDVCPDKKEPVEATVEVTDTDTAPPTEKEATTAEPPSNVSILEDLLKPKSAKKKPNWMPIKKRPKPVAKVEVEEKIYKFTKAKDGKVKGLQFLESGFWRKLTLSEEEAMKEFEAKANTEKYLSAPYKCTDCHKSFSQKIMIDRHLLRKHGEANGSIECRFCKMRFKRACFLSRHMRQHLTRFECLRCNLVCNVETTALFHEEYHSGVIRKCPHCHKEFRHLSTFYTHLRTHRSKHMCTLCGESFVSPLGLRQHKRLKHVTEEETAETDAENNIYCEICKITFETKDAYTKHLLHSAMHTDDFVGGELLSSNLALSINTEEADMDDDDDDIMMGEKKVKPKQLYERKSKVEKTLSAVRKSNLPAVAGRGWTKKPTTCQHCNKHFSSQTACRKHHLQEHLRAPFHTEKDRIICEVCGASLAPGSVAAHINQHTRRKMYTCETCGRSFTTNHVLRNHMATHTGERNYACNICGKRFTQNGSLSLHYRTVHLKQPYIRDRKKKIDDSSIGAFFGKAEFM